MDKSFLAMVYLAIAILATTPDHSTFAQQTEKAAFQFKITLKSGETFIGTSDDTLELETSFGTATIRANRIRKVKIEKSASITTAAGVELQGKLTAESISIRANNKLIKIPFAEISQMVYLSFAPIVEETISDGIAGNGVSYHLRVPKGFDRSKKCSAIVILHGSNMNSKAYVNTIASAWPKIAERYVLVGINGEKRSSMSKPGNPRFNYTYVNFAGKSKYRGFPGTDRESPALVSEVISEIRDYLNIGRLFVGGHSQGGFLTYSIAMNYPDLVDGVFPMSCGLIVQCEPTAYADVEIREKQRRLPIAIIHAPNDKVVKYSLSEYAYQKFVDEGFTQIKMFENQAQHMFALLPVEQAINWLEDFTTDDPQRLYTFAKKSFDNEEYRTAMAALKKLSNLDSSKSLEATAAELRLDLESIATIESRKLTGLISENKNGNWVDRYYRFQQQFRTTKAGRPVVAAFEELRKKHQRAADRLFKSASKMIRGDEKDEGYLMLQEIVDHYYASSHYRTARKWIAQRAEKDDE